MGKLTSRVEKLYRIFSKAAGLFAGLRAILYFIGRRKRKQFLEAVRQSDRFFLQAMIFFSPCIRILKRKQGWKLRILKVISQKTSENGDFIISLDDSQKKISNEYSIGYSFSEQLKKIAEPLSNRSDIYSLGMTLYVLANDKKFPDQRDVLPEIEEISVELNAILGKACSYYPGNRYQSAAELRKELLKLMITKYC